MKIIWQYLRPQRKWIFLAMLLAAIAQILQLIDPIIFGQIVDKLALNPGNTSSDELMKQAIRLLLIATGIALLSRIFQAFTDYVIRYTVQKFGMEIFNEGLRHTLRLPFQEFEETSSGQVLSTLQKVRTDTERFVSSFINIVFSALVGVGFLIWYSISKHWALIPCFSLV
jgi:ATP-binding cassette, subfamily B, bacterial